MTKLQAFFFRSAMVFFGYVAAMLGASLHLSVIGWLLSNDRSLSWFEVPFAIAVGLPIVALFLFAVSLKMWAPVVFIGAAILRIRNPYFFGSAGAALAICWLSKAGYELTGTVYKGLQTFTGDPFAGTLFITAGITGGIAYWAVACHLADRWARSQQQVSPSSQVSASIR